MPLNLSEKEELEFLELKRKRAAAKLKSQDRVNIGGIAKEAIKTTVTPFSPFGSKVTDIARNPEARQFAMGVGETATGGIAGKIIPMEKPKTPSEKFARGAGSVVGFAGAPTGAGGLAVKGATKILPKLAGKTILAGASRGAVRGAISGAATDVTDIKGMPIRAGIGAAVGAPSEAIFSSIKIAGSGKELAKRVRNAIFETKQNFGKQVETAIEALPEQRTIDLSDEFTVMKDALDDKVNNPGLASDIKSIIRKVKDPGKIKLSNGVKVKESGMNKLLNDLISNPQKAKNITPVQVQEIKKAINNVPVIARKLKQGKFADWTQGESELLDLVDNIRAKQLAAYPEIAPQFQKYHEVKTNYDTIKNTLKKGRLIQNIEKNWGDPELQEIANSLLPKSLINDMGGYRNALKFLKVGGILGGSVAAGVGGAAGIKLYQNLTK